VADPVNGLWHVWDNPGDGRNPVYNASKTIKPSAGSRHSWIDMTNDGKAGAPRRQHHRRRENAPGDRSAEGRVRPPDVHTEKALFLNFQDGKLLEANNQFCDRRREGVCGANGREDE